MENVLVCVFFSKGTFYFGVIQGFKILFVNKNTSVTAGKARMPINRSD